MLEIADRRLYLAKQQGRNRVIGALPRLRSIPPPPVEAQPDLALEPQELEPPSQVHKVERMARAFAELSAELQLVVGLHFQENCSFAEIATILDSTEEQVRALYEQARTELRRSAA